MSEVTSTAADLADGQNSVITAPAATTANVQPTASLTDVLTIMRGLVPGIAPESAGPAQTTKPVPTWVWIAGAAVLALLIIR